MDDAAGADHGAGTAGEALVREDKGAVFRNLDRAGGADLFAQAAANAANLARVLTPCVLV